MELILDKISFEDPFFAAIASCEEALVAAGATVDGAANRAEAASREKQHLKIFRDRLADLIRTGKFSDLHKLRAGLLRTTVPYCHHLTVGPWRGVFFVRPGSSAVFGLSFSKYPHAFSDRRDELIPSKPTSFRSPSLPDDSEDRRRS
jgi:hypothetical protein